MRQRPQSGQSGAGGNPVAWHANLAGQTIWHGWRFPIWRNKQSGRRGPIYTQCDIDRQRWRRSAQPDWRQRPLFSKITTVASQGGSDTNDRVRSGEVRRYTRLFRRCVCTCRRDKHRTISVYSFTCTRPKCVSHNSTPASNCVNSMCTKALRNDVSHPSTPFQASATLPVPLDQVLRPGPRRHNRQRHALIPAR